MRTPQAVLPPFKETHYFDSLEQGTSLWAMDQMIAVRQGVRADISAAKTKKVKARLTARVREMDRWLGLVGSQIENDGRYQALMRRRAGADTVRLCADITPAYALLSEDCFRRMAAMNGGDTRFVMVLRDPIDRLWSNISMTAARRAKKGRDLGSVTDEMPCWYFECIKSSRDAALGLCCDAHGAWKPLCQKKSVLCCSLKTCLMPLRLPDLPFF